MINTIHEEEPLDKAFDGKLLKRLLFYLKPYWFSNIASILLLIMISCIELYLPIIIKNAIDGPITSGDYKALNHVFSLFMFAIIGIFLLS
ncbi:hypothetical protein KKB18_11980, partial [bacterium]|nr:hypothetical protein [bacterium]